MATNTITIAADGSGDYPTLDEAVQAANSGATIIITGGEHWLDFPLVINKTIQLVGEGVDSTLLIGRNNDCVVEFEASGVFEASGITFWHDGKQWADVVRISAGTARLKNCRFTGGVWDEDKEVGGDGLIFAGSAGGTVQECEFYDNALHGIEIGDQSKPELESNLCANNHENGIAYFNQAGGAARNNRCEGNGMIGIAVNGEAAPELINNFCSRNQEAGIAFFEFASGSASGNVLQENDLYGLIVQDDASPTLGANSIDNNPSGNRLGGKSIQQNSPLAPTQPQSGSPNEPSAGTISLGKTITINSSSGGYTFEEAVQAAGENGAVQLDPGSYLLAHPMNLPFPVRLTGAGRDLTVVICRKEGWVIGYDQPGVFQAQGITFRHEGSYWADVLRIKAGEIDLKDCRFTGAVWSDANEQGGDGLVISGTVKGSVRLCEAAGNALHGIEVGNQAAPLLAENVVTRNDEDGIAYFENAGGRAFKNRCEDNGLFGIALNDQTHPDIIENVCSRNGEAGIGFFDQAGGTISGNWCEENALYGLEITGQARPTLAGNLCNHNLSKDIENTASVSETLKAEPEFTSFKNPSPAAAEQPEEEVFVTVGLAGGVPTLGKALEMVGPGATIQLSAGDHFLEAPLTIRQPVRLVGDGIDSTTLSSDGEGFVFQFSGPGLFSAEGITFQHSGRTWADVVSVESGEVDFLRCAFVGGMDDTNGERGGNGLVLSGSVFGSVARCEMIKNEKDGILVMGQAQPALLANICRQNKEAGISFSGSAGGLGRENHCVRNGLSGIYVSDQAHPTLRGNICHENDEDGIAYEGSGAGTARENQCLENKGNGIFVGDGANPTLENNSCHRSGESGITFSGSARGIARENQCEDNQSQGIAVEEQAQPVLETNACSHNVEAGIAYFDNAGGKAWGNQCEANLMYGIGAQDQAQPMLEANTCHQNKLAGITFAGDAWGIARENICTENGRYGLSVEENAHPELIANQARDNRLEDQHASQRLR